MTIIKDEIAECDTYRIKYGWEFEPINTQQQKFIIKMTSPIDNEIYIIEIGFDNYKELPLDIDFIDPDTGARGTKNAFPINKGENSGFFHGNNVICHPASRKAYKKFHSAGPHADWNEIGWQNNPRTGALVDLKNILIAIYRRISLPSRYVGRI